MAAHRTPEQVEIDRDRVAEMYLQKRPLREIARVGGIIRKTVSLDIRAVQRRWAAEHPGEYAYRLALELARIDLIEVKAWERFEAAVAGRKSSRTRLVNGPQGQTSLGESSSADPANEASYLRLVCWCVEQRSRMLGLYKDLKVEANVHHDITGTISFDSIEDLDAEFKRVFGIALPPVPVVFTPQQLPPGFRRAN